MRPLRASLVLAILAALLGAPSIASAASNSLRGASVSPTSGSVATVFTFTVTYDGHFAATSMTVAAGGAVLPMTRTGGTPEAGTWSGSGMLPAGTWVPVFTASVEQGADAVLAGPTVTVSGPGMPPASSPPSGGGGSTPDGGQIEPTDPGSLSTPYPAPAVSSPASPVPGSAIQTPGPTDAPTGGSAPRDGSGSDGGDGGSPAPGTGSTGIGSAGAGSSGGGSHDGPSTGASGGSDDDGSSGGSDDHPGAASADRSTQPGATGGAGWFVPAADERDDDESDTGLGGDGLSSDGVVEVVLLIALSGVAAVALAGTALLMTGRRRSGRDAERAAEAARTEAVLHERMLRRARVRLDDDDPIVAAIGDDEARHRSERGTPRTRPPES